MMVRQGEAVRPVVLLLSGWLRFDLQLLETKMLTWLSDVADKTTVELNQLNVIAKASKK